MARNVAERAPTYAGAVKAEQMQIRRALGRLAAGNARHVQDWLDRVASVDPAKALDLWLRLVRFSVPELKAIALEVTNNDEKAPAKLSIADLENYLRDRRAPIEGNATEVKPE